MSKPFSTFKPRFCVICGKEFIPYNSNQKTCSLECRKKLANKNKAESMKEYRSGLKKKKKISNMKSIEAIVKDDPEYGLKVAVMEGRLVDKNAERVKEKTREILQEVMEELRI